MGSWSREHRLGMTHVNTLELEVIAESEIYSEENMKGTRDWYSNPAEC